MRASRVPHRIGDPDDLQLRRQQGPDHESEVERLVEQRGPTGDRAAHREHAVDAVVVLGQQDGVEATTGGTPRQDLTGPADVVGEPGEQSALVTDRFEDRKAMWLRVARRGERVALAEQDRLGRTPVGHFDLVGQVALGIDAVAVDQYFAVPPGRDFDAERGSVDHARVDSDFLLCLNDSRAGRDHCGDHDCCCRHGPSVVEPGAEVIRRGAASRLRQLT
nr:hypothetical protein [Kibdelosporangium sp. MJ126-NF4]CTQ94426.1 hypothetical protein [Kibdelosporangium sp. MJ126-NF4]